MGWRQVGQKTARIQNNILILKSLRTVHPRQSQKPQAEGQQINGIKKYLNYAVAVCGHGEEGGPQQP